MIARPGIPNTACDLAHPRRHQLSTNTQAWEPSKTSSGDVGDLAEHDLYAEASMDFQDFNAYQDSHEFTYIDAVNDPTDPTDAMAHEGMAGLDQLFNFPDSIDTANEGAAMPNSDVYHAMAPQMPSSSIIQSSSMPTHSITSNAIPSNHAIHSNNTIPDNVAANCAITMAPGEPHTFMSDHLGYPSSYSQRHIRPHQDPMQPQPPPPPPPPQQQQQQQQQQHQSHQNAINYHPQRFMSAPVNENHAEASQPEIKLTLVTKDEDFPLPPELVDPNHYHPSHIAGNAEPMAPLTSRMSATYPGLDLSIPSLGGDSDSPRLSVAHCVPNSVPPLSISTIDSPTTNFVVPPYSTASSTASSASPSTAFPSIPSSIPFCSFYNSPRHDSRLGTPEMEIPRLESPNTVLSYDAGGPNLGWQAAPPATFEQTSMPYADVRPVGTIAPEATTIGGRLDSGLSSSAPPPPPPPPPSPLPTTQHSTRRKRPAPRRVTNEAKPKSGAKPKSTPTLAKPPQKHRKIGNDSADLMSVPPPLPLPTPTVTASPPSAGLGKPPVLHAREGRRPAVAEGIKIRFTTVDECHPESPLHELVCTHELTMQAVEYLKRRESTRGRRPKTHHGNAGKRRMTIPHIERREPLCKFASCVYAHIGTRRGSTLAAHMVFSHLTSQSLTCERCEKDFSRTDALRRHIRVVHRELSRARSTPKRGPSLDPKVLEEEARQKSWAKIHEVLFKAAHAALLAF